MTYPFMPVIFQTGRGYRLAITCLRDVAKAILDEHGNTLGFALSHVAHLLHPNTIVLGGGLALLGEEVRSRVAAALPRYLMEAFQPGPEIKLAALGEDAVPVGALALAALSLTV